MRACPRRLACSLESGAIDEQRSPIKVNEFATGWPHDRLARHLVHIVPALPQCRPHVPRAPADHSGCTFGVFWLRRCTWYVHRQHVRLQGIATATVITVDGELDGACAVEQTPAAHDLCAGFPSEAQPHINEPY